MRIKITQKGWEGYTGILGTVTFENGVSTHNVSKREADYFGVIMRVVEIDEDGKELGTVSANAELVRTAAIRMPVETKRPTVADLKAQNPEPAPALEPAPPPIDPPSDTPPAKLYSREELEAIADEKGIKGLREIGTPLGAKNTSIHKLIDEIVEAQTKAARA